MRMAKAKIGKAFDAAIGNAPSKQFGHEGLISGVRSGDKVPEYFARIVQDEAALIRLIKGLADGNSRIRVRTVIEIDE